MTAKDRTEAQGLLELTKSMMLDLEDSKAYGELQDIEKELKLKLGL